MAARDGLSNVQVEVNESTSFGHVTTDSHGKQASRFHAARDQSKAKALEAIWRLARPSPPGFKFDRDEGNER